MGVYYKEEHFSCDYHGSKQGDIFQYFQIGAGDDVSRLKLDGTFLLFLLEGAVTLSVPRRDVTVDLISGQFILMSSKWDELDIKVTSDCKILTCLFPYDMNLCSRFSLQDLQDHLSPAGLKAGGVYLQINERLQVYFSLLLSVLFDGVKCVRYMQMKREELFLYLRIGYSKEELALLFAPVLSVNFSFKDFVISNYNTLYDVKAFAEKANMSVSTFNRRFKAVFNETAQQWMMNRKAELIMDDILLSNHTITEIAAKHGFSSVSYFNVFCRRVYGKSPCEIKYRNE